MKKIINIALIAVAVLSMGSCVGSEQYIYGKEQEKQLVLNLRTPQAFGRTTRQLSAAQEDVINKLTVLVFQQNIAGDPFQFSDWGDAEELATAGATTSATMNVKIKALGSVATRFVVLANCPRATHNIINANSGSWKGYEYEDVASQLVATIPATVADFESAVTAASPGGGFPMCGQVEQFVDENTTTLNNITLTRSLARVDVGVGTRTSSALEMDNPTWNGLDAASNAVPFQLEDVQIINAKAKYRIAPIMSGSPLAAQQSLPDDPTANEGVQNIGIALAENMGVADNKMIRKLYLPETNVLYVPGGAPEDEYFEKRIAVIVGGYFDENGDGDYLDGDEPTKCYYRLDFTNSGTSNLMTNAVLRNTIYRFSIMGALSHGADTPEEAYTNKELTLEVTIEAWTLEDMDPVGVL